MYSPYKVAAQLALKLLKEISFGKKNNRYQLLIINC